MPSPNSPPTSVSRAIVKATSPAPGLQKQPVRSEILCRRGEQVDVAFVDDASVRVEEVEGDGGAAPVEVARPVDGGGRRTV